MSCNIPKIIAHRGASGYAPENTLDAIQTAADMGFKWVELDVKITKDNVPVIFHDDELDRTTNGSGLVAQATYDDIRALEAGSWFGDSFAGIKIPTLEEALDVLINNDMGLNLEIKPCPGRERVTAEIVLDHLSQSWDDHNNLLISSFQHVCLEIANDMAEDWHRSLLMEKDWPENWSDIAKYLNVACVNIDGNNVTREQVEAIIDENYPVLAYTINDPDKARQLQGWGVDGFFTDYPDSIEENLLSIH